MIVTKKAWCVQWYNGNLLVKQLTYQPECGLCTVIYHIVDQSQAMGTFMSSHTTAEITLYYNVTLGTDGGNTPTM